MSTHSHTTDYLCGNKNIENKEQKLYLRVLSFLATHCRKLLQVGKVKVGEDLLNYYNMMYDRYIFSRKVIGNRIAYLDKFWVPRKREAGIRTPSDLARCTLPKASSITLLHPHVLFFMGGFSSQVCSSIHMPSNSANVVQADKVVRTNGE